MTNARKAHPEEESPVSTPAMFTLELTLGELQAVKVALARASELTGAGKILTGQAELKVDRLLPSQEQSGP